jgi:hypothetical protein
MTQWAEPDYDAVRLVALAFKWPAIAMHAAFGGQNRLMLKMECRRRSGGWK